MKKTHDAIASVGAWTDATGKRNKRTVIIGALFESDHGRLVLRLDAVPVSREWSGWVALKERSAQIGMPDAPEQPAEQTGPDPDEDIPF